MNLNSIPICNTRWDKEIIKEKTKQILKEVGRLQYKMYAQGKYSLLIVFQGMDAFGKDGLAKSLFRYCSPVVIKVKSLKNRFLKSYHTILYDVFIKKYLPAVKFSFTYVPIMKISWHPLSKVILRESRSHDVIN